MTRRCHRRLCSLRLGFELEALILEFVTASSRSQTNPNLRDKILGLGVSHLH